MATHDELQEFTLPPHTVFPPHTWTSHLCGFDFMFAQWLLLPKYHLCLKYTHISTIWKQEQASRKGKIKHCIVFKRRGGGGEIHKYRTHNKKEKKKTQFKSCYEGRDFKIKQFSWFYKASSSTHLVPSQLRQINLWGPSCERRQGLPTRHTQLRVTS